MESSTSVDTLVYQLEDDDASVRWDTIQRLRKRAAVERAQLPVRNPRRFLHCLRRRLSDEDPRIARETLLLLTDVIDVLRDDVEQILASILPHLISRLPRDYRLDASESNHRNERSDGHAVELGVGAGNSLHEETFHVFRKYVNATNDLAGVVNVLVNLGLAHSRASVREAALLAIVRLLDERYGRRHGGATGGGKKSGGTRVDTTMFTDLSQAIVPTLEDADEQVVVAAEEAIAKIQLYWGPSGFREVMQFLGTEDKATLKAHDSHIQEFVSAASAVGNGMNVSSSVTASQVLKLRASLPVAPPTVTTLRFGFVPADIIDTLNGNTGNSNAEWKKRTASVEQLYACAKHVDRRLVRAAANADAVEPLMELIEVLLRLLQDIDVHLVKRSLQILRLIFYKLEIGEDDGDEGDIVDVRALIERLMPGLVETAANYAEDEEVKTHAYTLLQTIFSGRLVPTVVLSNALLNPLLHRRLQIREEAARVWMVLLLTAQAQSISTKGVVNDKALNALGRALGDGSSRVRQMALEVAAVLASVTRQDICAIIEEHLDDFTLERIDLDTLYGRMRSKNLPVLLENGQLKLENGDKSFDEGRAKAQPTRSPVRAAKAHDQRREVNEHDHADGFLDVRSELREVSPVPDRIRHSTIRNRKEVDDTERTDWGNCKSSDLGRRDTADQVRSTQTNNHSAAPREIVSAPGEPMADKLLALKRKTELLKKSASSKQVVNTDRYFNPQEGDFGFASAGYAAQQPPPFAHPAASQETIKDKTTKVKQEVEFGDDYSEMTRTNKSFRTPRDELMDEDVEPRQKKGLTRTPPGRPDVKRSIRAPQVVHEDRPIRPQKQTEEEYLEDAVEPEPFVEVQAKPRVAPMSLATKKRLEAKQKLEQELANAANELENDIPEPSPEAQAPATRPISLATRKRLEAKTKNDSDSIEDGDKASKRSSLPGSSGPGKQEPRYLEAHELSPLKDPKQEAAKAIKQLHLDDWEANFDALTTIRRLAAHHTKTLQDQIHPVVTEILKQVPNLRSSVAKNALLALDSMCSTLGKLMDGEVDNIIPVLMKRCLDSNTFVCESASSSINAVILNCSTSRVVFSIAANLSSRAIPIRREVARAMHTVIVGLSDQIHTSKELGSIFSVLGKCLEDSNNEVRDAAKQSILYLYTEQGMNADKMKKMLPSGVHSKVDSLLTTQRPIPAASTRPGKIVATAKAANPIKGEREIATKQPGVVAAPNASKQSSNIGANRRGSTLDAEELATLIKKLDNVNWKDRFDALNEVTDFASKFSSGLCESGKITLLFDSILKRMEDGNAKVSTQTMELLPAIISAFGNGMELVLSSFVPAVAKGLASSNPKQSSLAQAAIQTLCSSVDARLLCQHFSAVARHANARVKPAILEVLDQLAANGDDKNQSALTRYVLPLSLELLKEAKSEVKDVNARLIRTLYQSLGQSMFHSSNKLSTAQQERLAAILGTKVVM